MEAQRRIHCLLKLVCGAFFLIIYTPAVANCSVTKRTLASTGYWGASNGSNHIDDETIYKFKISVSDKTLRDLNSRIDRTRFSKPLEDAEFTYGFNGAALQKTKVVPLLIVHGWPGSVVEFMKLLPLLTTPRHDNIAFEVICPSIPGFGFSEAPHKKGLNPAEAGRIFLKLMKRLGHEKFYVQGGDFGAVIVTSLTKFYPNNVLVFDDKDRPPSNQTPFDRSPSLLLEETGYFHIQATKPDTVGAGLDDSPAGLAAYIGEKFSSTMSLLNRNKEDGGLFDPNSKISLDHILTNIMIYWVTQTGTSSVRFYKEALSMLDDLKYPISPQVPAGIAIFPNDISTPPRFVARQQYPNILTFTYMKEGGHFAAMEEPEALAGDIRNFVHTVESLYPRNVSEAKPFQYIKGK